MDLYSKLEFNKVIDDVKKFAHTEIASYQFKNLKILDKEDLQIELDELKETIQYVGKYQSLAITNHKNIMPSLSFLLKDGVANVEFLSSVSNLLRNVSEVIIDFKNDEQFPILKKYVQSLKPLDNLRNRIDSVVSPDLSIYDNASSNLNYIRRQIMKEQSSQGQILNSLMNKYRNYLNDERMAFKEQGLTLPIKATYKNRVNGIVLDVSSSGNTYFIQPIEILQSNNKINELKIEEQQEILIILRELSKLCLKEVDDIRRNLFTISHLDYLFAKALYASETKSNVCNLSEKQEIILLNARHPLINKEKVISNTFILDKERIMLITGPNAGGKTVALKTVGLLSLMFLCGLPIPVDEESVLPYFDNIFVDIGDDQSLLDNLSTFTAHMVSLKNTLENVNENSLVLIDELGTGTAPSDGEALGIGVLKFLHEKHAFAILSSHYDGLKSFALENTYILNASMIFNEEKLSPTYKIRLGVAGKSYGLEVAQRENIPSYVIEKAKEYLEEKKNSDKELALNELNQRLNEIQLLKESLQEQNVQLHNLIKNKQDEYNKVVLEKRKLEDSFEKEKEELIKKTQKEIKEMMESFKNKKDVKLHEVINLKKNVDNMLKNEDEEIIDDEVYDFKVNDYVLHKESSQKGTIKQIVKDNVVLLLDSGLTLKVKASSLRPALKAKKKKQEIYTSFSTLNKNVSLECNVIGCHVDEALSIVAKYLDDARCVHFKEVRIIHGSGTGRLRQAIQTYLKKQTFVEDFRLGGAGEGGVGATVVKLK